MRFRSATFLLVAVVVAACGSDAHSRSNEDAGAPEGPGSPSDAERDADAGATSQACVYRPSTPEAWSVLLMAESRKLCSGRGYGTLRCEVVGNDGPANFRLACFDREGPGLEATLSFPALPEALEATDATSWALAYRPDIRGDNGDCHYDKGLLAIRDAASDSLLIGLADTVEPRQDLSTFFAPVAIHVQDDHCDEEVVNPCGLPDGPADTRQAQRVELTVGASRLELRAGERGEVDGMDFEVHRATLDTGHPCCNDCGSGASELAFRLK